MAEQTSPSSTVTRVPLSEQLEKLADAADQAIERYNYDRAHQDAAGYTDYELWQSTVEAAARLQAFADKLYEVAK